jgi:hypothetical protein
MADEKNMLVERESGDVSPSSQWLQTMIFFTERQRTLRCLFERHDPAFRIWLVPSSLAGIPVFPLLERRRSNASPRKCRLAKSVLTAVVGHG